MSEDDLQGIAPARHVKDLAATGLSHTSDAYDVTFLGFRFGFFHSSLFCILVINDCFEPQNDEQGIKNVEVKEPEDRRQPTSSFICSLLDILRFLVFYIYVDLTDG